MRQALLLLSILLSISGKLCGQICSNQLLRPTIHTQFTGGGETMLIHRPDIADSAYEFFLRINDANFGMQKEQQGAPQTSGNQGYLGYYALTDTCSGKFSVVDTFSFGDYAFGIPLVDTLSANPFTGFPNNVAIHKNCSGLPPDTLVRLSFPGVFVAIFPYDTVSYMREYWYHKIVYLPYTCGKWQISRIRSSYIGNGRESSFLDLSTNLRNLCGNWNSINPYIFAEKDSAQLQGHFPLIQFSNAQSNQMPHYLSQMDFRCPINTWNSIPLNAVDPDGDSLSFSASQGATVGNGVPWRGQDLSLYGDLLPHHLYLQWNPVINWFDTLAVSVDTLWEGYKCLPGQGPFPNCATYDYLHNPFDCDSTYSVDPQTGEIRFYTKSVNQHVYVTVKCDEYRQGAWLSSSYRVIRLHTVDSAYFSNPQFLVDTPNVQQAAMGPNNEFYACAGANIQIPFDIIEPQGVGYLTVTDNHAVHIPTSNLSYTNNATDSVRGLFTWNTLPTDSGWYSIVLDIVDSSCTVSDYIHNTSRVFKIFISPNGISGIPDTTICQGDGVPLFTQGAGSNIQWNVLSGSNASLSCNTCQSPIATPNQTTTYEAESQLTGSCKARDTVTITVQQQYSVTATDLKVCGSTDSVQLQSTISSSLDPSAQIISWQPLAGIYGSNNTQAIWVNPNMGTQYIVSLTDTLGCFMVSDTASIDYDAVFAPFINTSKNDICQGDTVSLSVFGAGADVSTFSPNYNISSTTGPTVKVWPIQDTVYEALVTSNTSGCTANLSATISVSDIRADAGPDLEIFDGEGVTLGGTNFRCDPLTCELRWLPLTYILREGVYEEGRAIARPLEDITYIQVVRSNGGGCIDRDTVQVKVKCTDIYMPNVFSPNSQNVNRNNHSFGPNNYSLEIEDFRIYNRWGELMFKAGDQSYRWNGKQNNGKACPTGVYIWYIKARCKNKNKFIEKKGNVTLLR